jgi:preprotein translocase subunit SecE
MADKIKLGFALLLMVAGVVGFYYLGDTTPMVLKLASVLAGIVLAALVGWTSEPGKQFYAYAQESVTETKKVVWPTRKETVQTTGMVVAFVIVMAIFLWLVDGILVWVVRLLLGTEA